MKRTYIFIVILFLALCLNAQPWEMDNSVFNPSGVPSFSFSQPRFMDLDSDGDFDFWLGNTNRPPLYLQNNGTATNPVFAPGPDLLSGIPYLASEIAVSADINGDGILDLVTGGFSGLHLFLNSGTNANPVFTESGGYFSGLNVGSNPVPDVADVDNDGDLDLVVGLSENGSVIIYFNNGSAAVGNFSESNCQLIGDIGLYAYPVFCDFDSDGKQDILCGRDTHGFVFYQNIGTATNPIWEENNTFFSGLGMSTYWNSPDLVDLNGDGLYDLVYGTAAGPLQYYVHTGTAENPSWQQNTSLFGGVLDVGGASNPVFYDFDGDGDLDLISGNQLGYVKFYRNTGTAYAPAWQEDNSYFANIHHSIYSAVTVGDVDADDLPDVILGDLNGGLYFYHNTGTGLIEQAGVLPAVSVGGWSCPRLIDMDFDGDLDLVVGNEAGNLFYYQNNGTPYSPLWELVNGFFGAIDVGSDCVPTFADVDEDSDLDMVTGNLFGEMQCFLRQRQLWVENTTLFSGIETDQNAAPALVDLDHDGDFDLVLGDYDGTFKFFRNLKYSGSVLNPPQNPIFIIDGEVTVTWEEPLTGSTSPFEHYKIYLDGVYCGSTTENIWVFSGLDAGVAYLVCITAQYVAGESLPVTLEFIITGNDDQIVQPITLTNYPNPFNPSTTISFTIPAGSKGTLEIYNVKGQKVRVWNCLPSGEHKIVFNGCNEQGLPLPSGIYFGIMKTQNKVQIRKMVLIK